MSSSQWAWTPLKTSLNIMRRVRLFLSTFSFLHVLLCYSYLLFVLVLLNKVDVTESKNNPWDDCEADAWKAPPSPREPHRFCRLAPSTAPLMEMLFLLLFLSPHSWLSWQSTWSHMHRYGCTASETAAIDPLVPAIQLLKLFSPCFCCHTPLSSHHSLFRFLSSDSLMAILSLFPTFLFQTNHGGLSNEANGWQPAQRSHWRSRSGRKCRWRRRKDGNRRGPRGKSLISVIYAVLSMDRSWPLAWNRKRDERRNTVRWRPRGRRCVRESVASTP